jgi:hypothetical protein
MSKKLNLVMLALSVFLILSMSACNEGSKTRTTSTGTKSTPLPDSMIEQDAGLVWITPSEITAKKGGDVAMEIHVNTGSQKIAAYGFVLSFDPKVIDTNTQKGTNGIDALPDGYVQAVNATKKGELFIAGFDVYGKGPGKDLSVIRVNLKAIAAGTSNLALEVKNLTDEKSTPLGKPVAKGAKITVN